MIVHLTDHISGSGHPPLQMEASQLLICDKLGNPIMVAGEFGPSGSYKVAHAGDKDFNDVLKMFGYHQHKVHVEPLSTLPHRP